jgi:cysteine desulfurase/selenocysteine lyase
MWKLGDIMIMNSQEEMGNSFLKSDEILSGYHSFIGSNHLDIMNKLANEIYKENIIPSLNAGPGTGEKGMPGKQSIGAYAGDFAYYFLNEYKEVPASKQLNGSYKSFDIDIPSIRKDFPILQRRVNGRPLVWLDNSATTQKPMQVIMP